MKKLVALILAAAMLLSCALAETVEEPVDEMAVQIGVYNITNETDNITGESESVTYPAEEGIENGGSIVLSYAIPANEDGNHRLTFSFKTASGYEGTFPTLSIEETGITLLAADAMTGATPIAFTEASQSQDGYYLIRNATGATVTELTLIDNVTGTSISFVPENGLKDGEETDIKVCIVQDQFGEQITWDIINSAGETVASGGPYQHLMGSGSTQVNIANVNGIATGECYLFRIFDSNNNGICCNYGNGYYYIKDAQGNRFIEGAGDYGAGTTNLFSIHRHGDGVGEAETSMFNIYPNPANSKIYVDGEGVGVVEVYNSLGQKLMTVEGTEHTSVDVAAFENGVYVVRVITNEGAVTIQKVTIAH